MFKRKVHGKGTPEVPKKLREVKVYAGTYTVRNAKLGDQLTWVMNMTDDDTGEVVDTFRLVVEVI